MKQNELYFAAVSGVDKLCRKRRPDIDAVERLLTVCAFLSLVDDLKYAEFKIEYDTGSGEASVVVRDYFAICGEGLHRFASAVANCDEFKLSCVDDQVAARFTVYGVW